jgi:hypothetical protein
LRCRIPFLTPANQLEASPISKVVRNPALSVAESHRLREHGGHKIDTKSRAQPMSDRVTAQPYGEVAQKWRDLAERRRAHFLELYSSGRWKRYYTEEQFFARMREVIQAADRWAHLAQRPGDHRMAAE